MDREVTGTAGLLGSTMLNPLPPYGQPHSSLLVVHDDVFFQVLDNVQKSGTLRALSETCRDIRIRCLPLLFCRCTVASHIPVARRFPPQTLWPYFKHLRLVDRCKDIEAEYWDVPLQFAQDPMLCGIYDGPFLENALQSMPRLSSVTFHLDTDGIHGLPWPVIAAVLSVPCLQEFRITAFLLCPKTLSTETISLHHPIPLTRLTYQLYDTRLGSRSWPTEKQALASILANTCTTLEKLTIPTEAAPFKYLSSARFPALRELHLRGDYRTTGSPPLSYVQVFANMPRLRYLDLRLGQVFDDPVPPLWPPGLDVPFPWPELEHITISHPVVNDRIYANLPPSLRSLTLRSFPHFATSVWMYGLNNSSGDRWSNFELLPASQMELIVRKLRLPSLEGLEIEYQEDGAEDDLLQYITSTFQTMTTITIRRARREDSPDISIENLGRNLAMLTRLRTIRLHLDLVDTPKRAWNTHAYSDPFDYRQLLKFEEKLQSVADALVAPLSPSVENIVMFKPRASGTGSERVEFRIVLNANNAHAQRLSYRPY